jgi:electron transfer flavoprotein beta subunit
MHILVVLSQVPDLSEEIEIAEDGRSIDREWIGIKVNEFDDHALEEALLLKQASGGTVTAIALEAEGVDRMLQTALARGADKALKLKGAEEGSTASRAAAPIFAAAARQLGADLIFTGVQTPEDIFGQLAPCLGAHLDWPHVCAVSGVRVDGDGIVVRQEYSGGVSATLRVLLPAVVGIQTASQPIRYVSGSKLRQFSNEKIATHDAQTALDPIAADLVGLRIPVSAGGATMLEGDADAVAAQLRGVFVERGLVKG